MGAGQHYLDYTGSGLYTTSQLHKVLEELQSHSFGNPHSRNPSSSRSTREVAAARKLVLDWFHAKPEEYEVIFTRSATQALQLLGEWFPWSATPSYHPAKDIPKGGVSDRWVHPVSRCQGVDPEVTAEPWSHFVYTRANHKSVLGVGAYARERGASVVCVDEEGMEQWLEQAARKTREQSPVNNSSGKAAQHRVYSLVAYPSKDNYEGLLFPLEWVDKVHSLSTPGHRWLVILDAAAYVPTYSLNLTAVPADFVPISFYKMFGYPTGLGCLLVRRDAIPLMHKVFFGGGSVEEATAQDIWRLLAPAPDRFEDGTVDFLGIASLKHGFHQLEALGGIEAVAAHVTSLQKWGASQLIRLRHGNGQRLLTLFGKHDLQAFQNTSAQSPPSGVQSAIFQFVLHAPNGSIVPASMVEITAGEAGLHLRTGCNCNPGACFHDLGFSPEEVRAAALDKMTKGVIGVGHPPFISEDISIRASLGALSTFEDVYALLDFLWKTYRRPRGGSSKAAYSL